MRILVVGDTHGNVGDLVPKIYKAGEHKINHVLVCGDFGLWTHFAEGHYFLDEVQEAARINNVNVFAIGGNHENWDHWNWYVDNNPTHKGFAMVRRRVLIAPKVHKWTWANKQFVGAGGAVSIDKQYRLEEEKRTKYGPKTLFWPNEQLRDDDVEKIREWKRRGANNGIEKVDYLFTHDCSDNTPWRNRLKPDFDSQIHRNRMDEVLRATEPDFHFHGHMHERYDWVNERTYGYSAFDNEPWTGPSTRTIGLEAFQDFNSWGVLDVDEGRWFWPSELDSAIAERQERLDAANADPRTEAEKRIQTASEILASRI